MPRWAHLLGRVGATTDDVMYRSDDLGTTWTAISDPSTLQFGGARYMDADLLRDNVVYVARNGRGVLYGQVR